MRDPVGPTVSHSPLPQPLTPDLGGVHGVTHGARRLRDAAILNICAATLKNVNAGRLQLTLPSGQTRTMGTGGTVDADLVLKDFSVFKNALRRGSLGFAEAYLDGTVTTSNLGEVFRFFIDNRAVLQQTWRGQFKVRRGDRHYHLARSNSRTGSRANITAHYDLGNAFYAPWLDASMTYSSALYGSRADTLEAAQQRKLDAIVTALDIHEGTHVLEIGCGWGALAIKMAEAGARVTAITISDQQYAWTRQRVAEHGLGDRISVQLIDYRDVVGTFDRVVSVEMIEAVGEEYWPTYFGTIAQRLTPGGFAVLQAITIDEQHFDGYRAKADFIQRYIFPGGMLPTERTMAQQATAAHLAFAPLQRFGLSYAWTLADWRDRFIAHWPELSRLGFDDRFYRMWIYYLTYCEIGFEKGTTDVGLYRFSALN